jgi:NADPH:quinone reductase-like Zn-dependent oxidoreductase
VLQRGAPARGDTTFGRAVALAALVAAGKLRVHVSHVVPLAEAARAHALLESGRTAGKIVLAM